MYHQSEQTAELCAALVKAQSEMKPAVINQVNPHFRNRYADLHSVIDAVRGVLNKHGIAVTQTLEAFGDLVLLTTLRHVSGQYISSHYPLPKVLDQPQKLGSALTYARRYSLASIVCIASDEDDDGEAAGKITPAAIPYSDPINWGTSFVNGIDAAKSGAEIDKWVSLNCEILGTISETDPKVHDRIMARVVRKRKSLEQDNGI